MIPPADALGVVRVLAACLLPAALAGSARGSWLPALLFGVAAASDFLDGIVARRGAGPTSHGAALDNLADLAFVLSGTGAAARLGMVPLAVPLAIGLAFGAYALASLAGRRAARSASGHVAGVLNYALVGLIAGNVALPGPAWPPLLAIAGAVVVVVNLSAVIGRVVPPLTRALVPRVAGTGARSPRS
jgi:phosphatidylglycerophosphate synthase